MKRKIHFDDIRGIDLFFLQQEEPVKSCLFFLREFIIGLHKNVTEVWHYNMPFYFYQDKRFCYLWVQKKTNTPYIGIVDGKNFNHPLLISEKRSRMKIMLIDPNQDIPTKTIRSILLSAIAIQKKKIK